MNQLDYWLYINLEYTRHCTADHAQVELDQCISNTHNQGHRNNRQSMTIGDQSVQMFHDKVAHRIHLAMGSIGHPCSTIQGSMRYLSVMSGPFSITSLDQANNPCSTVQERGYLSLMRPGTFTLLDQTNNPCSTVQALRGYLSLMRPGQQPMQYYSSFSGHLSLMRPCSSSIISLDLQSLS